MSTESGLPTSDVAFSPAVKAEQARRGSRTAYARMETTRGWARAITPELQREIEAQTSVFLATASADGQPYVQHRGGAPGFLRVLDERTLAFVEYDGNRQYITQGNLSENPRAQLFLIDYRQRRRIKIWGRARVINASADARLATPASAATAESAQQAIVFEVTAWDLNCPRHIPQRFDAAEVQAALLQRDQRIAELEAQLARVRRAGRVDDAPARAADSARNGRAGASVTLQGKRGEP